MNLRDRPEVHTGRLIALLPLWAAWMRSETWGRGYPRRSSFLASGGTAGVEAFEHLCDAADAQAVRTLDALIDDLPAICRAAVHCRWCAAVWRFREGVYDTALDEAYERLGVGLHRWGIA